jgi:hypothetical protein
MASPRFEASAALAAQMWSATGQAPVDGVIAIDPVALEQLLKAVGPVTVGDRLIDSSNVVDELLHQQYLRFPSLEERPERREALGDIARATLGAFDAGTASAPVLAEAVADSVRGRHLMAWASRPEEQAGWHDAGADGRLRDNSLLVSVLNRGGNKLDRYLETSADLGCAPAGPDRACTLRVDLRNTTPVGEPPYIAGPHPGSGVNEGDYLGIVTANLPGDARNSSVDGIDELAVVGADGPTRVVGYQLVIPRGEMRTMTVHFTLPGRHGTIRTEPTSRVPGIRWSSQGTSWDDGAARTLSW